MLLGTPLGELLVALVDDAMVSVPWLRVVANDELDDEFLEHKSLFETSFHYTVKSSSGGYGNKNGSIILDERKILKIKHLQNIAHEGNNSLIGSLQYILLHQQMIFTLNFLLFLMGFFQIGFLLKAYFQLIRAMKELFALNFFALFVGKFDLMVGSFFVLIALLH